MTKSLALELASYQGTALSILLGWLCSEIVLEEYGVTEANWRDALAREPHFIISEQDKHFQILLFPHLHLKT